MEARSLVNQRGKASLQEVLRLAVAVSAAVGATVGYLQYTGPDQFLARANPELIQRMARPDAFTSEDGRELEGRVKDVEQHVRVLENLMRQFLTTGPTLVRNNQDKMLEKLEEIRRAIDKLYVKAEQHRQRPW